MWSSGIELSRWDKVQADRTKIKASELNEPKAADKDDANNEEEKTNDKTHEHLSGKGGGK